MQRNEADWLIPGHGESVRNAAVGLDGATIAYAGPIEGAPKGSGGNVVRVPALMPGMWDVHGHFMGIRTLNVEEIERTPPAVLASRATKDAETALSAVFTSIPELSDFAVYLSRVIVEVIVPRPHTYASA